MLNSIAASMEKYGVLVQMYSTFETNRHNWPLFNDVFKDTYGVWLPGFHFLLASETADRISLGLQAIKTLLPDRDPMYFVVDDSASEKAECF